MVGGLGGSDCEPEPSKPRRGWGLCAGGAAGGGRGPGNAPQVFGGPLGPGARGSRVGRVRGALRMRVLSSCSP